MRLDRRFLKRPATRGLTWVIAACALGGCIAAGPPEAHLGVPGTEQMSADQLGQTDFNRTVTVAMDANLDGLDALIDKLYRRNPREWRKSGQGSHEEAMAAVRVSIATGRPPADVRGLRDVAVLAVALDPEYRGDRIATLGWGLADTIIAAHNGKTRFYAYDVLNGQHVFNAARNVEAAAWLLSSRRDAAGEPLLLANEIGPAQSNLSFEREFGAIIGRLDLVASLLGENSRRLGINYAQNLLFFAFLPVR